MRGVTPHGGNPALDLSKLPGYLSVASNGELATLAQQARNPAIISAVDVEMKKRQGGAPAPIGQSDAPVPTAGLSVGGFRPQLQSAGPEAAAAPAALLPRPVMPRGGMPMGGWPSGPDMMTPRAPSYPTAGAPTPGPDAPGTWTGPNGVQFGEPRRSPAASTAQDNTIAPDSRGGWIPPWQRTPIAQSTNAALQAGTTAAADATGATAPDDVQQQVMQRLMGKPGDQSRDVGLAILRAGLGMMASSSPNALQAIGEGGAEGLDYYTKTRQQEAENQARAAGIQGQVNQQTETGRSNRATEGISRGNLDVAKQHATIAANQLAFIERQYQEGRATDQQLKQAQIRASEASTAYSQALAGNIGVQYVSTPDGLQKVQGSTATPVIGADGKPIEDAYKLGASGAGGTAQMKNIQDIMDNLHVDYGTALGIVKTGAALAPSARRAKAVALANQWAAGNVQMMTASPTEAQAQIAQKADEFEQMLMGGGAATGVTPAPIVGAPAPNSGAAAPPKYTPGSTIYIQGKPYTVDPNGTSATPQ